MKFFVFGAVSLILLGPTSLAFSSTDEIHQQQTEYCASKPCDSIPNMFCDPSSNICKCRNGMYQDPSPKDKNRTCLQWLDSTCRDYDLKTGKVITLPCTANATCDNSNVCRCSEGFYRKYKACELLVAMGGYCSSNIECGTDEFTGSQLVCLQGICSCDPHRSVYASVRRNVGYGGTGSETAMCAPLATQLCYKGFCAPRAECSLIFFSLHNHYWDGTRTNRFQPQSAACKCGIPYQLDNSTLDCLAPYNGICNFEIPCIDGYVCNRQTGRCECTENKFYDYTLKTCITNLGMICFSTSECPANAQCRGRCYCNQGYVKKGFGRCASCVPDYGALCNVDSDCDQRRNTLICAGQGGNKRCTCQRGLKMFPKNKTCALLYGASCNWTANCGDDMKCTMNGICNCTDRMHFDTIREICVRSIGDACTLQDDCGTNAFCNFGVCRCRGGYVSTRVSGCAAGFGTPCRSSSDCAQITNDLICQDGKCACKGELRMSITTGLCSPALTTSSPSPSNQPPLGALNSTTTAATTSPPSTTRHITTTTTSLPIIPSQEYTRETELTTITSSTTELSTNKISGSTISSTTTAANGLWDGSADQIPRGDSGKYPMSTSYASISIATTPTTPSPLTTTMSTTMTKMGSIDASSTTSPGITISPTVSEYFLEHGAPCNNSTSCAAGQVCKCRCSCPTGQYFDSNRCISYAQNVCTESADCVPNAGCFNETCVCSGGYVQSPFGECKADIGIHCSSSADCDCFKNQLICTENHICDCSHGSPTDGVCSLESGTLKNSTCDANRTGRDLKLNETCPPGLNYGDSCNDTCSTCLITDFLKCQNGTCVCKANFHFDAEQETCSHVDGHGLLGNVCIDGSFCTAGECVDGICECPLNFYRDDSNSCSLKKSIHEPCSRNSECGNDEFTASDLLCLNGTCSCNSKTSVWATAYQNDCRSVYSHPKLFCAPLPNQPCFQGFCSPGAICRAHFFGYGKNSFYINTSSRQANNYTMPICDCLPPFKVSPKSGLCSSPLEHLCNSTVPCMDNLECNNETCTCTSTQHLDPDANICRSLVSQSCSQNSECTFFSHCADGVCSCQTGYKPSEAGLCAAEVGGFCSVDADCDQVNNKLNCSEDSCQCKTGLKLNPTTGKCSLPYNAKCISKNNCSDTVDCINGQCVCDGGFYNATQDRCLSKVDEPCNRDSDCVKWSFCYFEFCHCNDKTDETGQRFCALKHRATCSTTDECNSDAGLVCKNFKCECPRQHVYSVEHGLCQGRRWAKCVPIRSDSGPHAPPPCVDNHECAMKPPSKSFKCVPKSEM